MYHYTIVAELFDCLTKYQTKYLYLAPDWAIEPWGLKSQSKCQPKITPVVQMIP